MTAETETISHIIRLPLVLQPHQRLAKIMTQENRPSRVRLTLMGSARRSNS